VAPFAKVISTRLYISCDLPGAAPTGSWTGRSCTSSAVGNIVSVRVQLQFTALTPLVGQVLGPMWLSGSATMVIN
jgi:hypothetical protein